MSRLLLSRSFSLAQAQASHTLPHINTNYLAPALSASRLAFPSARSPFQFSFRYYAEYPPHLALQMPALSPTMEKGNLARWSKKIGDRVESGDVIASIETDKSEMHWDVSDEGYLAATLVEDQTEDIPVGQVIAVLCEEEEDVAAFKDYKPEETASKPAPKKKEEAPPKKKEETSSPKKEASSSTTKKDTTASPKKKQQEEAPKKKEAKKETPKKKSNPSPDDQYEDEEPEYTDFPNSSVLKETAAEVTASKQTVPHYYLTVELNADNVLRTLELLNSKGDKDAPISVNDFVVKAATLAMRKVPEVNSSWNEKAIRRYKQVHINVAVTSPDSLYSPLITDTGRKGLKEISQAVNSLTAKAQEGTLSSEELRTGTFTISNLAQFNVNNFSAIVRPPQACHLAVGGIEPKTALNKGADAIENPLVVSNVMTCTLSCDHRVVDGASGAQWLQEFKARMEDPMTLLL